jgi:hypothetical protein
VREKKEIGCGMKATFITTPPPPSPTKKKEYKKLKYYGSKLSLIMYCKFIVKIKK